MRLVLAFLITVFLLGGTLAYTRFAASVHREAVDYDVKLVDAVYTLEIRRSFIASADTDPDPIWGEESRPALDVRFKGQSLLVRESKVPVDEEIRIDSIPGVEVGANEIFVSANRESSSAEFAALQVVVKLGGSMIAEETFSSSLGSSLIYGTLEFEGVSNEPEEAGH